MTSSTHLVQFPCHFGSWKIQYPTGMPWPILPNAHWTLLFQVFPNPLFDSVIGVYTTWIFIIPRFMVLEFRKQVILHHFVLSKSPVLMHDFSISLYQCVLFYFIQLIIAQFSIYVKFLSVYDHGLWRLVVAL